MNATTFANAGGLANSPALATPTLARLYLQQGHYDKAKVVLDAILRNTPDHGEALALAERLAICDRGTLKSRIVEDHLEVAWQIPLERPAQHVAVRIDCFVTGAASAQTVEIPCEDLRGKLAFPLPASAGACALCLVHRPRDDEANASRMLAIGRVHTWSLAPAAKSHPVR